MEYKKVLTCGKKIVFRDLVVFVLSSHNPRVGIIASKKVGNAVARNKAKRMIREAYRQNTELNEWELVVIARKSLLSCDFSDVFATFEKLRQKLANERSLQT